MSIEVEILQPANNMFVVLVKVEVQPRLGMFRDKHRRKIEYSRVK